MGKFLEFLKEMAVVGNPTVDYRKHISFDIDKNNIIFKEYGSSFYDKESNVIFLNDKSLALSDNWARTIFGDKNYVREIVKSLVKYFNIKNNINIHVGRYNGKIKQDSFYSDLNGLLSNKESLGTKTITFYHGTTSIHWEQIQRFGLRSLQSTGITQFNSTGRYYPNKNPIYLTTIPNRAWEYAETAHKNNPIGEPIILKIILPIQGNESHFWADDDWLDLQQGEKEVLKKEWRRSLKETGQVVYLGRIPSSEIELYFPKELRPIKNLKFEKIEKYSDINYPELISTAIDSGVDYSKICNKMYNLVSEFAFETIFTDEEDGEHTLNEALKLSLAGSAEEAASVKQQELEYQTEHDHLKTIEASYEFDGIDELYDIIANDKIDETWDEVFDKDRETMETWFIIVNYEIKQFEDTRTELFT